jgi:hypothetical protein
LVLNHHGKESLPRHAFREDNTTIDYEKYQLDWVKVEIYE